jgi:hypothetical protein
MTASEQREEDILAAMRRAKVDVGFYPHVHSIVSKYPPERYAEIMRSLKEHAPTVWFRR